MVSMGTKTLWKLDLSYSKHNTQFQVDYEHEQKLLKKDIGKFISNIGIGIMNHLFGVTSARLHAMVGSNIPGYECE